MKVLIYDPSGNFAEGNGTTGWSLFEDGVMLDFGELKASDWASAELYWDSHLQLISKSRPDTVVYETYRLRAGKAMEQSWSQLETPQLIGVIRWYCALHGIECVGQDPSLKERYKDSVLVAEGIAEKKGNKYYIHDRLTNEHMRDAIRHGHWYHRYGKGKKS